MARNDVQLRYIVDVIDKGLKGLLADDRRVRNSAKQTSDALQRSARQTRASISGVNRVYAQQSTAAKRSADATDKAHHRMGASLATAAKRAAVGAAGFAAAYTSIQQVRGAVEATVELGRATTGLSKSFGLTIEEASRWAGTMKARGVDAKATTMAFTTLSRQMTASSKGTKSASDAFKTLGITQNQVKAGQRDFQSMLFRLADGLKRNEGSSKAAAAAQRLFGRGAQSIVPVLRGGSAALRETMSLADKYGVTLNAKTLPQIMKFSAQQREWKTATLGLKVAIGTALIPTLTKYAAAGTKLLAIFNRKDLNFDEKMKKAGGVIKPLIADIQRFGGRIAKVMAELFEKAAPAMADAAARAAPRVVKAFVNAWLAAGPWGKLITLAFLAGKMGAFRAAGGWAARAFGNRLQNALGDSMPGIFRRESRAAAGAGASAGAESFGGRLKRVLPGHLRGIGGKGGILVTALKGGMTVAGGILAQVFADKLLGSIDQSLTKQAAKTRAQNFKGVDPATGKHEIQFEIAEWLEGLFGRVGGRTSNFERKRTKKAGGGRIGGSPVAADTVPAMLSPQEFVVTGGGEQMLEQMTFPGVLDWLQGAQPAHFQGGGRVHMAKGGWVRMGATWDNTHGQGVHDHNNRSFAELLQAGQNRGLRKQSMSAILGLRERKGYPYGAPLGTRVGVKMPGDKGEGFDMWKNDVGSGQGGSAHYKIDLHPGIIRDLKWKPNQDVMIRAGGKGKGSESSSAEPGSRTVTSKVPGPRIPDVSPVSGRDFRARLGDYLTGTVPGAFAEGFGIGQSTTRPRSLAGTDALRGIYESGLFETERREITRTRTTGSGNNASPGSRSTGGPKGYPLAIRGKLGSSPADHGRRAFGNWQSDNAWDISVPVGTMSRAVVKSRVVNISGHTDGKDISGQTSGLGITLRGGGNEFFYKHLLGKRVNMGDIVPQGGSIGPTGGGNNVPHLHFGVKHGNPSRYLRRGGRVGFQAGGRVGFKAGGRPVAAPDRSIMARVGNLPTSGTNQWEALLEHLSEEFAAAANDVLGRQAAAIRNEIWRLGTDGLTGREVVIVRRLRGVLSTIDMEMGRRSGAIVSGLELQRAEIERSRTRLTQTLRLGNIDEGSMQGMTALQAFDAATIATLDKQRQELTVQAINAADWTGRDTEANQIAAQIGEQVREVTDTIAEMTVVQVERQRAIIVAAVEATIEAADRGVVSMQSGLSMLDVTQRAGTFRNGTFVPQSATPGGMRDKAAAIQAGLPAMEAARSARGQAAWDLMFIDPARSQALGAEWQAAGVDIASAMADAADLIRSAAEQERQDILDRVAEQVTVAGHGRTMADLGLQGLELRQRIAGTFDAGGQERATFITTQVLPQLQAELSALNNQQAVAQEQGNAELARQVAEAIAGKQNDILQAQLTAQEQTAQNTQDMLREFAGAMGFQFHGQQFTDIVTSGVGA